MKKKLFDLGQIKKHDPRIFMTDGVPFYVFLITVVFMINACFVVEGPYICLFILFCVLLLFFQRVEKEQWGILERMEVLEKE